MLKCCFSPAIGGRGLLPHSNVSGDALVFLERMRRSLPQLPGLEREAGATVLFHDTRRCKSSDDRLKKNMQRHDNEGNLVTCRRIIERERRGRWGWRRMAMRKVTFLVVVVALSYHATAGEDSGQGVKELIEALRSPTMEERAKAMSEIRRQRIDLIRALIDIVATASDEESTSKDEWRRWQSPKYVAISLLGELRAEEAVNVLAWNITWRVRLTYGGYETGSISRQFPAAYSLARIGSPAVPKILSKLRMTKDPLERHLCVWALVAMEQWMEGRAVARFRLLKAIEGDILSGMKPNLEAALPYLDKKDLELAPEQDAESAPDSLEAHPGAQRLRERAQEWREGGALAKAPSTQSLDFRPFPASFLWTGFTG